MVEDEEESAGLGAGARKARWLSKSVGEGSTSVWFGWQSFGEG